MKQIIHTGNAPKAIGPYSQAIKTDSMLFISGQIPLTKEGQIITGDIYSQAKQCLANLDAILTQANLSRENVVKTTIFLQNMDDFADVNRAYAEYFDGTKYPARATVGVNSLPKGVLVEIEAIAIV